MAQSYEHLEPYDEAAALRNQIVRTRADLGDTLQELASRADVKARAREAVAGAKLRAREAVRSRVSRFGLGGGGASDSDTAAARHLLMGAGRGRMTVVAGGAAGALVGYGLFKVLRRQMSGRHPLGRTWGRR
jgi:hypothetical protein